MGLQLMDFPLIFPITHETCTTQREQVGTPQKVDSTPAQEEVGKDALENQAGNWDLSPVPE